jgi:sterol O-acyltransferase
MDWGSYYRRWNLVVHEWLLLYVRNDAIRFSLGRLNRAHAMNLVFLVSAIVHEHIIACALGAMLHHCCCVPP